MTDIYSKFDCETTLVCVATDLECEHFSVKKWFKHSLVTGIGAIETAISLSNFSVDKEIKTIFNIGYACLSVLNRDGIDKSLIGARFEGSVSEIADTGISQIISGYCDPIYKLHTLSLYPTLPVVSFANIVTQPYTNKQQCLCDMELYAIASVLNYLNKSKVDPIQLYSVKVISDIVHPLSGNDNLRDLQTVFKS